jgi:hypothetical protein
VALDLVAAHAACIQVNESGKMILRILGNATCI